MLLNGVAGKEFKCKRGVRQGYPLSPLLFVLAADLLQSVINKAYHDNILQPPFPQHPSSPFPIVQYADDTLHSLKGILQIFSESTSLKVNYGKSCLVLINTSSERPSLVAEAFGCLVGNFPFTYLGLPLGITKPQVKDYAPLLCRIERRISASSQFLSYAGRLQLINSVVSSLPTYFLCSLKIPVTVIEGIDKYRKDCLWRGSDFKKKGYNLAAWQMVMKPKDKGGLGLIDLTLQNQVLLLKQLDKIFNKKNVQWVNLIWNKYYSSGVPHFRR